MAAPRSLDWVFDFGKYKLSLLRTTLKHAIDNDLPYVKWCLAKVAGFTLDKKAQEYFDKVCDAANNAPKEDDNDQCISLIDDYDGGW